MNDPRYRFVELPGGDNRGTLADLKAAVTRTSGDGETVRFAASGVTMRARRTRRGVVVVTDRRVLFVGPPPFEVIASYPTIDLAVAEPDADGISVRDDRDGTVIRFEAPDPDVSLMVAQAISEAVFGPAGVAGGSPHDRAAIGSCIFLGGHGLDLVADMAYVAVFDARSLVVRDDTGREHTRIPLEAITALDISPPDVPFELVRALMGSLVRLETPTAEGFFLAQTQRPEALRIRLSDVLATISGGRAAMTPADQLDRLERLAALHRQGLLTDGEFSTAKERLLNAL